MANPNQYFLLADHIKLCLLERQRAISLNLEPTSQDGHISRSLDSLHEGLEKIVCERERLQDSGDASAAHSLEEVSRSLQAQYDDLTAQFRGPLTIVAESPVYHPNNPPLSADFAPATDVAQRTTSSSLLKKSLGVNPSVVSTKSVRFSDAPLVVQNGTNTTAANNEAAAPHALFPYRDDPSSSSRSGTPTLNDGPLDPQQMQAYHTRVLAEQDAALDRLGASIGRQRELSIRIGDELDEHVEMLDAVDRHVDLHQTRLVDARRKLGSVARRASDHKHLSIIISLIVVLVLLIVLLK